MVVVFVLGFVACLTGQEKMAVVCRATREIRGRRWPMWCSSRLAGRWVALGGVWAVVRCPGRAGGWLARAEAEYERAGGPTRPETWSQGAKAWQRLERLPLVHPAQARGAQ